MMKWFEVTDESLLPLSIVIEVKREDPSTREKTFENSIVLIPKNSKFSKIELTPQAGCLVFCP
jgi:hypothetical protein